MAQWDAAGDAVPDPPDHFHSASGVRRGQAPTARDGGSGRGHVGQSDADEEEWRSIREPIMDLLSRSSSELDRRRNERRPDPEDPTGEGDGNDNGQAEDASGFYSSGTGGSSLPASYVGKKGRHRRVSRPGEDPAGESRPNYNNASGTYYGASHRGDMKNYPKAGRPKKDKDSDLEAMGGYADHRSRVKFADDIFGGRESRQRQEMQQQQPQWQQEPPGTPYQQKQRGILYEAGSVASKGSVESSSYNIAASADLRRRYHHTVMKRYAVALLAISFIMAILKANYFHNSDFPETEGTAARQRAALEMEPPDDISLRAPPGAHPGEPPESEAQMQLQIQKEMIEIQNDIINAQAQAIPGGERADDATAGEAAIAGLKTVEMESAEEAGEMGQGAREAERQRVKEENVYRTAMERQAREERNAEVKAAMAGEEGAPMEGAFNEERVAGEQVDEHLRPKEEGQWKQEPTVNGDISPWSGVRGGVEGDEGEEGILPLSGADLAAAQEETKAMLEASRQKAREEEDERLAREESLLQGQVVQADPQDSQNFPKEGEGEEALSPGAKTQLNEGEEASNDGGVGEIESAPI